MIANQINFNKSIINKSFYKEIKKIYESFGYNNIQIKYSDKIYKETNTADLYFTINEGSITKINQLIFDGNKTIFTQEIRQIIKSKTKTLRNIFANNNFKPSVVERDKFIIINYYKNKGFIDVDVKYNIEYLDTNKVNIYFNIDEGDIYLLSNINIDDTNKILNKNTLDIIKYENDLFLAKEKNFSIDKIQSLKQNIFL